MSFAVVGRYEKCYSLNPLNITLSEVKMFFSQAAFSVVASDVTARARVAQGEQQTIKTFTYLVRDRHLDEVGFNIFFFPS